jgi:hypothetical protein
VEGIALQLCCETTNRRIWLARTGNKCGLARWIGTSSAYNCVAGALSGSKSPIFRHTSRVYHKSVKYQLRKKIFCLVACFFDFFCKNQKKGEQTLFYFAAGGGEILVTHPLRLAKNGSFFASDATG